MNGGVFGLKNLPKLCYSITVTLAVAEGRQQVSETPCPSGGVGIDVAEVNVRKLCHLRNEIPFRSDAPRLV